MVLRYVACYFHFLTLSAFMFAFSASMLLCGRQKGIRPVKNWVMRCWHGCLSGARCRLAHGPADATATHWQLCKAFNFRILYGLYLPTVILTIIWWPPTHSFTPGLKPFFSANPFHCSPSFLFLKYSLHGFPGLFTVFFWAYLFSTFSFSVFTLFSCRLRAVD